MNKDDLNQLVTKQDLENFKVELSGLLLSKINPLKEFYTPKEFEHKTGIPYSTVIYKCTTGRLKAFQDSPNCSWLIYATELDRFKKEADENFDDESNAAVLQ
jgi:predicted transcriptional regulator